MKLRLYNFTNQNSPQLDVNTSEPPSLPDQFKLLSDHYYMCCEQYNKIDKVRLFLEDINESIVMVKDQYFNQKHIFVQQFSTLVKLKDIALLYYYNNMQDSSHGKIPLAQEYIQFLRDIDSFIQDIMSNESAYIGTSSAPELLPDPMDNSKFYDELSFAKQRLSSAVDHIDGIEFQILSRGFDTLDSVGFDNNTIDRDDEQVFEEVGVEEDQDTNSDDSDDEPNDLEWKRSAKKRKNLEEKEECPEKKPKHGRKHTQLRYLLVVQDLPLSEYSTILDLLKYQETLKYDK